MIQQDLLAKTLRISERRHPQFTATSPLKFLIAGQSDHVRDDWVTQDSREAPYAEQLARGLPCAWEAFGYQPRPRHSARCGRSAPSVVSLPWPG
jgi:hypothetical protein